MAVHKRLTGLDTNIRFDQLVKLVDPTLEKYNKDAWKDVKIFDQKSQSCWSDKAIESLIKSLSKYRFLIAEQTQMNWIWFKIEQI